MSSVEFFIASGPAGQTRGAPSLLLAVAALAIVVAAIWLVRDLTAPQRPIQVARNLNVERARLAHGSAHISCFATSAGEHALAVDGGVVAYASCGRVAVALGDPLTEPSRQANGVREFVEMCRRQGCLPCFFQSDAALREVYSGAGLRVVKFGEEAVVDLADFDLGAPAHANARREVARARRAGLTARVLGWPSANDPLWADLTYVSDKWLASHGGAEMGFSLGRLGEMIDSKTWLTVAQDEVTEQVHAFCTWLRIGSDGVALDMVRRRPDAAPGAVDMCVVAAIDEGRRLQLTRLSLGSVPFRDSLGDAPESRILRLGRAYIYRRGLAGYRYANLAQFKSKFATRWCSRDIALPHGVGAFAALGALAKLHTKQREETQVVAGTRAAIGPWTPGGIGRAR